MRYIVDLEVNLIVEADSNDEARELVEDLIGVSEYSYKISNITASESPE